MNGILEFLYIILCWGAISIGVIVFSLFVVKIALEIAYKLKLLD